MGILEEFLVGIVQVDYFAGLSRKTIMKSSNHAEYEISHSFFRNLSSSLSGTTISESVLVSLAGCSFGALPFAGDPNTSDDVRRTRSEVPPSMF